jgi:NAD(P)-dependent dehydrogenase (short-subunit alcohol dehydrogenase family)
MRYALVTGASSGIGAGTARVLARNGYRLALIARRVERLHALVAELPKSAAGEHLALCCDLGDPAQIRASFARVREAFGRLDLLVNNAGLGYRARVEELDDDEVRRVLNVNIGAVLLCCREGLPLLMQGQRPCVVNVSSVVGRRGMPTMAAYAATKAAVFSIGESLRLEWAHRGIAVCTLAPGVTATEIFAVQSNPSKLHDPDLAQADTPESVGEVILALDRKPVPERYLRWKWKWLGALSVIAPSIADRALGSREWIPKAPEQG